MEEHNNHNAAADLLINLFATNSPTSSRRRRTGNDDNRANNDEGSSSSNNTTIWVFGYGSLCWYPGFEYQKCVTGYIRGYVRRFWQGNNTHRGTIEKVSSHPPH